ncbi:diguanylate cyclase (GGDEF) domain-containing protein [Geodermatophilus africanus]|uniref:Diguanylate cyclase (GGDEF) domain-containing protein n=1 Tax=Geodermatophilus africanus TaxID=1137993 RepID=A0A1H3PY93_9ACTN|nr:EAL domain-containing protein [Geodermatophilus africanus]SDZ05908.1 diguanylate cyclase (GGDEF) domain-containing protein [Geodermatophilus africanus]
MRRWRGPLIVSVVYLALWLGLDAIASVFQARQEVSLWYPPTGLSFALLLVFGLRYAPLLLLTDPLHGLVVSSPAVSWVSVWLGGVLSTAVYTVVAWLLLRRLRIDPRLPGQRDVAWFLGLAAVAGPLVVAVAQVLQYTVTGLLTWGELFRGVLGFWSGRATGVGVLAPALLVASRRVPALWRDRPPLPGPVRLGRWRGHPSWVDSLRPRWLGRLVASLLDQRLEPVAQAVLLLFTVYLAYGEPSVGGLDLAYLVYVPLIWIAVRGGLPRAAFAVLVANAVAVALVGRDVVESPLRLQLGLVTLTLAGLTLGALVTGRQASIAAAEHAALHDPLTGLANRVLLMDRVEAAAHRAERSPGARFAVLYCDLDGFKGVNDQLGHDAGDELLVAVARRLEAAVRPADLVSRLGGDEMAVLLDGVTGVEEAAGVAERLLAALAEPYDVDGREVVVTVSVGVAVADGEGLAGPRLREERAGPTGTDEGGHGEELLRAADMALQRAKANGGHRYELFNEPLRRQTRDRLGLRAALRRAVEAGAVTVAYQPIVRVADGRLTTVEVLARWHDAERGDVLPVEFITAAEETGLIHDLGMQVLEQACTQATRWRGAFGAAAPRVAVNVSTRQLLPADFAPRVLAMLDRVGLPPDALELEMTESCAMEPGARVTLERFTAAGVTLAVDDFGTGYSSFAALRERTPQAFKLDRSFVARLPDDRPTDAIVSAVLALAGHLGATVTAEGVETQEQLQRLQELGCPQVQGFLLSRPATGEQIERDWLRRPR